MTIMEQWDIYHILSKTIRFDKWGEFQAPTGIMNNEKIKKAWNSYCGIIVLIDKQYMKKSIKYTTEICNVARNKPEITISQW